eukprot:gene133-5497_t
MASASWDNKVRTWDTATGKAVMDTGGHTDMVQSVAFASDGKTMASASRKYVPGDSKISWSLKVALVPVGAGKE